MTIKTYFQAQKYLEAQIPRSRAKKYPAQRGLNRMRYLLKLLNNPQNQYPTLHVGGTSGKGSTCYLIASILTQAGFKTGLHLSPHLQVIPERMQINNQLISEKRFIKLVNQIIPVAKKVSQTKLGSSTYFEILLAMTFLYFAQEKVDFSVIEVGMGGQFDGTNVLKPQVTVLTNVSLDHTHILGKTVQAIAKDKREIIKPRTPVITAVIQPSVIKLIKEKCQQTNSPLFILNQDLHYQIKKSNQKGSLFNLQTPNHSYQNLQLNLLGQHQVKNATLAISAIELVKNLKINKKAIRMALSKAFFPGRLEIIQKNPLIVLDGAHNPEKMRALVFSFPKLFNYDKLHVIFALTKTKDLTNTLKPLLKITDDFIATEYHTTTDLGQSFCYPAEKICQEAQKIKPKLNLKIQKNAQKTLKDTIYNIGPGDALLITGSLYLVGEIRSLFYPNKEVLKKRSLSL